MTEEILRKPFRLPCEVILPNRICKTATSEHLAHPITGEPLEAMVELYRAWAEGGSGLIITGNVMVDEHLEGPGNVICRSATPSAIWQEWARASKTCRRGSQERPVAIVQLSHPGRQSPPSVSLCRPVAPSTVPFRLPGVGIQLFRSPRTLTTEEVKELPTKFATAAALAVAAGFDGVQIHAAHGYLLSQFLSPHTNRRSDSYGGSAANRRRLLLEILAAIRIAIGTRRVLSVKVNCADFRVGGLEQPEALELMAELKKASVDLVEISGGTYETMAMMTQSSQEGYFVDFSRTVREKVPNLPVMAVGGFKSLSGCVKALKEGECDVVGICRALCLQPDLPSRWFQGEDLPSASKTVRITVPVFGALLIPGLGYYYHQRQMQRIGYGKAVELQCPTVRMLLLVVPRKLLWEPRRLSSTSCCLWVAALATGLLVVARAVKQRA